MRSRSSEGRSGEVGIVGKIGRLDLSNPRHGSKIRGTGVSVDFDKYPNFRAVLEGFLGRSVGKVELCERTIESFHEMAREIGLPVEKVAGFCERVCGHIGIDAFVDKLRQTAEEHGD